jgi:hypothetical protein
MRELFILIAHLLVTLAKLAKPRGLGTVAAESLAVKHQLLIMKTRATPCSEADRMGSPGAGSLCIFRSAPTSEQASGDPAAFHPAGLSSLPGAAQVSAPL